MAVSGMAADTDVRGWSAWHVKRSKRPIQWASKSTSEKKYVVNAYFSLHNGLHSPKISPVLADQVWYAAGEVSLGTDGGPHLEGFLSRVWTAASSGMSEKTSVAVRVLIFASGEVRFQRLINQKPVGGMGFTTLNLQCIDDDLLTGLDGTSVVTVGVARGPAEAVVEVPK